MSLGPRLVIPDICHFFTQLQFEEILHLQVHKYATKLCVQDKVKYAVSEREVRVTDLTMLTMMKGCSGLYWTVVGCKGCTGLYWAVLGYSVCRWVPFRGKKMTRPAGRAWEPKKINQNLCQ